MNQKIINSSCEQLEKFQNSNSKFQQNTDIIRLNWNLEFGFWNLLIKLIVGFVLLLISTQAIYAQKDSVPEFDFSRFIYLDSVVITASRSGFDTDEFVDMVRADSSFYEAFRNLRFVAYDAENDFTFYNKKNEIAAAYTSTTRQYTQKKGEATCRTMDILEENITGKYYKRNRKPRYYTTKMFERLFFAKEEICETRTSTPSEDEDDGRIARYVTQLKKLIFQPGEKVNVPVIGGKTAIFEEKMAKYYDYSINSEAHQNGMDCYVFRVNVKPEFEDRKEGKTVVKSLETFFEKKTFQVIGRNYRVAYYGALFDFDVRMNVKLTKLNDQYLPEKITYDGFWKIPTQKLEKANFTIKIMVNG